MNKISDLTNKELEDLINNSKNYAEVLRKLGFKSNSGGAFRILKEQVFNKELNASFIKIITEVSCKNCSKKFSKRVLEQKRFKNNFCSHSCSATYNNKNKSKGTRVSKLELFIQKKLKEKYSFDFQFNCKIAIKSELDIYVPELKLAFELNGIFHFKPIFGIEKFHQIQNNDNKKIQKCLEQNIDLNIIDVSWINYNKISNFEKVWEVIENKLLKAGEGNRNPILSLEARNN